MHICTLILRTMLWMGFSLYMGDNIFRNKEIDRYVGSSEWRDDRMKLQTMLRDTERERAIEDLKKSANRMRQLGANEANTFKMLKEDYHSQLSDEEIRKYMNETK